MYLSTESLQEPKLAIFFKTEDIEQQDSVAASEVSFCFCCTLLIASIIEYFIKRITDNSQKIKIKNQTTCISQYAQQKSCDGISETNKCNFYNFGDRSFLNMDERGNVLPYMCTRVSNYT